jgi:hypothetical protein
MKSFSRYLEELYVSPHNGAKYGQVIFLVGGAGSGKSTATRKYINTTNYKILNPDDLKELLIRAGKKGVPSFKDMTNVDPNTPEGSTKVHQFMRDTKIGSRKARTMVAGLVGSKNLPNLLFDRTFAFAGEFKKISQGLIKAGYKSENIHVVFVMTDVELAVKRNKTRSRSLPTEVVRGTNEGARKQFIQLFFKRAKGAVANGDYYIIINRGESAIQVKSAGKPIDTTSKIADKVAKLLGIRGNPKTNK